MIFAVNGHIGSGKSLIVKIIQYLSLKHYHLSHLSTDISTKQFLEYCRLKDTILSSVFVERKFADTLKDFVCTLLNCTRDNLEDSTFKNMELGQEWWYYKMGFGRNTTLVSYLSSSHSDLDRTMLEPYLVKMTPRLLMQILGTDAGRNIVHPDIWVNALMRKYVKQASYTELTVENYLNPNADVWQYPKWVISDMRFPNEMEAIKRFTNTYTIRVNSDIVRGTDGSITPYTGSTHESEIALDNASFDYYIQNNADKSIEDLIHEINTILKPLSLLL